MDVILADRLNPVMHDLSEAPKDLTPQGPSPRGNVPMQKLLEYLHVGHE